MQWIYISRRFHCLIAFSWILKLLRFLQIQITHLQAHLLNSYKNTSKKQAKKELTISQ